MELKGKKVIIIGDRDGVPGKLSSFVQSLRVQMLCMQQRSALSEQVLVQWIWKTKRGLKS